MDHEFVSESGRTVIVIALEPRTGKGSITVDQDDRRVQTIDIGAEKSLAPGNAQGAPDMSQTMLRSYASSARRAGE